MSAWLLIKDKIEQLKSALIYEALNKTAEKILVFKIKCKMQT